MCICIVGNKIHKKYSFFYIFKGLHYVALQSVTQAMSKTVLFDYSTMALTLGHLFDSPLLEPRQ